MTQMIFLGNAEESIKGKRLSRLWRDYDSANTPQARRAVAESIKELLGLKEPAVQDYLRSTVAKRMEPNTAAAQGLATYIAFAQYKLLLTTRGLEELVKIGQLTGAEVLEEIDRILEAGSRVVSEEAKRAYVLFGRAIKRASSSEEAEEAFERLLKALGLDGASAAAEWEKSYEELVEAAHREILEAKRGTAFQLVGLVLFLQGLLIGGLRGRSPEKIQASSSMRELYDSLKRQLLRLEHLDSARLDSLDAAEQASDISKNAAIARLTAGASMLAAILIGAYCFGRRDKQLSKKN